MTSSLQDKAWDNLTFVWFFKFCDKALDETVLFTVPVLRRLQSDVTEQNWCKLTNGKHGKPVGRWLTRTWA